MPQKRKKKVQSTTQQNISSQQEESQSHMAHRKIRISYREADEQFGKLCESLLEDEVPFNFAGWRTIFMSEKVYARLPNRCHVLLEKHKAENVVKEETVEVSRDRELLRHDEALTIARRQTRMMREQRRIS